MESELESSVPEVAEDGPAAKNGAQIFTFRELATATNNFRNDSIIGEGGFGPVYRGKFEKTGQVIFNNFRLLLTGLHSHPRTNMILIMVLAANFLMYFFFNDVKSG